MKFIEEGFEAHGFSQDSSNDGIVHRGAKRRRTADVSITAATLCKSMDMIVSPSMLVNITNGGHLKKTDFVTRGLIHHVSASHRHFADEDIVLTVPTCLPHICTRRAFWPKIVLIGEHFSFENSDHEGEGHENGDRDGGGQANQTNEGESGHESDHESFSKDGRNEGHANEGDESGQKSGYESGEKGGDQAGHDFLEDISNEVDERQIQQQADWAMVGLAKRHRK